MRYTQPRCRLALFLLCFGLSGLVRAQSQRASQSTSRPAAASLSLLQASGSKPHLPNKFPYSFSNIVWWSDQDIRAQLKRRIPGLPDEMSRDSPFEGKVRKALEQMLNEKGIHTSVMSEEPAMDTDLRLRVPDAPPLAIVFSFLPPPDLFIEQLTLLDPPPLAAEELQQIAANLKGKPYGDGTFWIQERTLREAFQKAGYLAVKVALVHGKPHPEGGQYFVPLLASVDTGPQFHVGSVAADGGPLAQGDDLLAYCNLHQGDIAQPDAFSRLVLELHAMYGHHGYADVDIQSAPELDFTHALASYHLRVTPGPQYHLGSVTVRGVDPTEEPKVLKLLNLKAGDIYDEFAVMDLSHAVAVGSQDFKGYDLSFQPREDKQHQAIDLILTFYKRQP